MRSRFRMKGVLLAALVAVLASAMVPSVASAGPEPGAKKKGFRLFARALGAMTINRVYCGLASAGQICVDSTNSSTIGGGFWPKGTADQYVFNSGLQIAGVIGPNGGPWANDTVGGFFFDPKGTTEHGEQVQPIYNAANPSDLAAWPEAACVPFGDDSQALFDDLLVTDPTNTDPAYTYPCRKTASQGDIWFMSWEGNTGLRAGRKHPLGIVAEQRGMGWNFPAGNEDIIYFIYTFYNVTTTDPNAYIGHRESMRPILLQKAQDLHAGAASLGVTLPAAGYTIQNMFAAFAADMDVGDAGSNYASVNLPFALGYTYDHAFSQAPGWTFDPSLFSAPFFPGAGFIGVKYLKSPTGAGEIKLFGNTVNGTGAGIVNDPRDVPQLFRYLSGTLSPATGDQPCNTGNPALTRICYVKNDASADMRFFQSSTPLTLEPGQSGSIVVAYIFAAPVATVSCRGDCGDVKPGDATRLTDPVRLAAGANLIDSLTGFRGYTDGTIEVPANDTVEQNEFTTVKGSLLGKALVAQSVFDNKFLLPFAPASVDFFLIPGDNQVTVMWKPTSSETAGDPFYAIANSPIKASDGSNNPLYDPNYRQFDVEGYRIYRGRVDAPNELVLLAQFDYGGTVIADYTGIVNPTVGCAPEFGINSDCVEPFAPNLKDGTALTVHTEYDLVGEVIQVQAGTGRTELANGEALVLKADTAVVGGGADNLCRPRSTCPALANTGVPFVYVDNTPRNNFRYFYAVTAFDVNSVESGPTSLESPRNTKAVRPVHQSSNYEAVGVLTPQVLGRGVRVDNRFPQPSINPTTGIFSGPFPATNGATLGFVGEFASKVVGAPGQLVLTLDSLTGGTPDGYGGVPTVYHVTLSSPEATVNLSLPLTQAFNEAQVSDRLLFTAIKADQALAAGYGGDSTYAILAQTSITMPGHYLTNLWGRGGANNLGILPIARSAYNGSRWFVGPSPQNNETKANPAGANGANSGTPTVNTALANNEGFDNGGDLGDDVSVIYQPIAYHTVHNLSRDFWGPLGSFKRAADYNVYWSATTAGLIDSVIDVTHNLVVPFNANAGASFGILTAQAAQPNVAGTDNRSELSINDFACLPHFKQFATAMAVAGMNCTGGTSYAMVQQAQIGPIVFTNGLTSNAASSTFTGQGFAMYMPGGIYLFQTSVLPQGTVWSLRDYVGAIRGGNGFAGNQGAYDFVATTRPFTAVGAQVVVDFDVRNNTLASSTRSLRDVHTVPDPYYVTNGYEQTTDSKILKFVNLPTQAIIRIYSSSGVLVNLIEHPGPNCQNVNLAGVRNDPFGGECTWNVRNRNNQVVASGVYFYHIESNVAGGTGRRVGRMTIVNFAQ